MRTALTASVAVLASLLPAAGSVGSQRSATCPVEGRDPALAAQIDSALRAGRDVWGETLLASPEGPTYAGASRFLPPLLLARAAGRTRLTASGVHYVPFSLPAGARGGLSVALHVADGSEIIAQRAGGERLTVDVGGERYGRCLARLELPALAEGHLPILRTEYVDSRGVRYRQESFTTRAPLTRGLVSFLRVTADARDASGTSVRFGTARHGFSVAVRGGTVRTVEAAWPLGAAAPETIAKDAYDAARRSVAAYWRARLQEGSSFVVPEQRVMAAQRALLIQNLVLTWRYSLGNAYEQFSFPEGIDAAQVMSSYGFDEVARAILRTSLTRPRAPYPGWKMGQKLVGAALHYRLSRDRAFLAGVTPALLEYVDDIQRRLAAGGHDLLQRERYSSDIPDSVYGLHGQAVVWQGLRWLGQAWAETGRPDLAARCRALAARLERGLRAAVRTSQVELSDGSLFLPTRLLDQERPYGRLTASRPGSYWNLVAPYALASGLFAPDSPEARGAWHYMRLHGSRLLGLVRAGAYALYGHHAPYPTSGTDQVYGLNVARFLASLDQPDQLVLSLYGQLAAAMTPGTFVAGEAASVTLLAGQRYRAMYLSPNGAANATLLGTLRLLLVNETVDAQGRPEGLDLAFSTPRAWLAPGKSIVVRDAPTSFGRLSYSIRSAAQSLHVTVDVPARSRVGALRLRLRLPQGDRIVGARSGPVRLRVRGETIELPIRPGKLELEVRVAR